MRKYFNAKLLGFAILFIALIVFLFLLLRQSPDKKEEAAIEPQKKAVHIPEYLYGICLDSFDYKTATIGKNEFFASILGPYNFTPQKISEIEDSSEAVFSVRKFQAGKSYTLFFDKDSADKLCYFAYEVNPVDYLLIKLSESVKVRLMQKEVDTMIKTLSGIITVSLWQNMVDEGASPILINKMSEIYEWDIDFFNIQKNDKYKLIYEDILVEGVSVGVGKIIAAWFEHSGEDFYAVYFVYNNREDYFDADGKNLRKLFLKSPLRFSRITSGFTNSRYHPILHIHRAHHGIDYAAPSGTPVHSVGDGTIIMAGYSGGGGNTVKIRHNSSYTTSYMHLSRFAKGLRKGKSVKQGDVIGYVGSTGLSTGPHLDYRIYKNNTAVNPLTLKMPPVESVSGEALKEYTTLKDSMIKRLNAIPLSEVKQE